MKTKEILIKILLAIFSSILIFFIIELILLNIVNIKNPELNNFIGNGQYHGNCYSSDKNNYFPIVLKDSLENQKFIKRVFSLSESEIEELTDETPHCIIYNSFIRKKGYFPGRKKEVIIVGDSFAYGSGVKDEDTLAYLLGVKFKEVNFRNFGLINADINIVYNATIEIVSDIDGINKIIYFYNLNDVLVSHDIKRQQKFITDFQNIRWSNIQNDYPEPILKLLSRIRLINLIYKTIILKRDSKLTINNYMDMYFHPLNQGEFNKTIKTITSLSNISENKNISFQIIIYPLLYKDALGRYPFKLIHDYLIDICKKNNLSCIDTYPAFSKYYSLRRFRVHSIDYHPNKLANQLVVDYLALKNEFVVNQNG